MSRDGNDEVGRSEYMGYWKFMVVGAALPVHCQMVSTSVTLLKHFLAYPTYHSSRGKM